MATPVEQAITNRIKKTTPLSSKEQIASNMRTTLWTSWVKAAQNESYWLKDSSSVIPSWATVPSMSPSTITPIAENINKTASEAAKWTYWIWTASPGSSKTVSDYIARNQKTATTPGTTVSTPTPENTTVTPVTTPTSNIPTIWDAFSEYSKSISPDAQTQAEIRRVQDEALKTSQWETYEQAFERMKREWNVAWIQWNITEANKMIAEQNKWLQWALEYAPKNMYGTLTSQELAQMRSRNSRDFIKNINDLSQIKANSVDELNAINTNIENVLKIRQQDRQNKMEDIKNRLEVLWNRITPEQKQIALMKLQQKVSSINSNEQSALDTAKAIAIEKAKNPELFAQPVSTGEKRTYNDNDIALLWSVTKLDKQGKDTLRANWFTEKDWAEFNAWMLPATTQQKKEASDIIDRINELENHPWFESATWFASWQPGFTMPGTDKYDFKKKFESFRDKLVLPNLWKLKWPMSDKDVAFLRNTATSLDTWMSEDEFKSELNKLKSTYEKILSWWNASEEKASTEPVKSVKITASNWKTYSLPTP